MRPTIYITGLPRHLSAMHVRKRIDDCGHVYACTVIVTPYGNMARIEFGTLEEASAAIREMDSASLDGQVVHVFDCQSPRGQELEVIYRKAAVARESA